VWHGFLLEMTFLRFLSVRIPLGLCLRYCFKAGKITVRNDLTSKNNYSE